MILSQAAPTPTPTVNVRRVAVGLPKYGKTEAGRYNLGMKICPRCLRELDTSEFPRNVSKKDGLGNYCSECNRLVQKEYRARLSERAKEPASLKTCARCKDEKPAGEFFANRSRADGLSGFCKACQQAAKDDWCSRNRGRVLAQARKDARIHRERYPDRKRERDAQYQREHPDARREHHAIRRARKHNAFVERVYTKRVWKRDGGICHLCKQPADPNDWHLDHIVPLASGGKHCHDNVAVAHPYCNTARGARSVDSPWEGFGV